MQQTDSPTPAPLGRDPQSFTRGDVLAWKVVGWAAAATTVVASVAAIIVFAVLAGA